MEERGKEMKIKCEYCGSMFDDTLEKCPNCGATNANVRRSTADQPTTIEGLKKWYEDRGLPPYETTRFFIGIDYKRPRAFGIYKDERTGNFVVYKNKDNGQRAVRYEGTDEAYAVNELLTRLKQEILQQKSNNIAKGQTINNSSSYRPRRVRHRRRSSGLSVVITFVLIFGMIGVMYKYMYLMNATGEVGYYRCDDEEVYAGNLYYHYDKYKSDWAVFDEETGDWKKASTYPYDKFNSYKESKKYILSTDYDPSYGAYDFKDSLMYDDYKHGFKVTQGYYSYNDDVYYHMKPENDAGWYVFDNEEGDWDYVLQNEIPADLKHQAVANDFWYTPNWSSETQVTDFTETEDYQEYQDYLEEKAREEAERSSSSDSSSDSSYDWSSSDSWDSGSTDWGSDW